MLFKNQATARRNRLPHIFWVFFYGLNQSYSAIYFYNSHEFRIISFIVMKCSRENMNKYLPTTLNRNAVVQRKYRKFRSPQLKHHTHPPSPCTRDWGLPTHWAGRGFIQSPNKFIRRVSFRKYHYYYWAEFRISGRAQWGSIYWFRVTGHSMACAYIG